MKKFCIACSAVGLAMSFTLSIQAQEKGTAVLPPPADQAKAIVQGTNEVQGPMNLDSMRYLDKMRSTKDPLSYARQTAIAKGEARRSRMNAAKWYGYEPLRPVVSSNPMMGNYFPIWNTDVWRPAQWHYVNSPAPIMPESVD